MIIKDIITYGIIAVLLCTTVIGAIYTVKYYNLKPNYAKLEAPISLDSIVTTVPQITQYDDSLGITHNIYKGEDIHQIVEGQKTEQAEAIAPIIEKLAADLAVSKKQVQGATTISTEVYAKDIQFMQRQLDSMKRITYYYKDNYLSLAVRPGGSDKDSTAMPSFDFAYNADLNIAQYWKKNWFLGAKKSYIDISSNDPRTTIKGFKTFTVVQKQPTLGLRLQAVGGYNLNSNAFFGGPSLRFDIKNISFRALYSYNTITHTWAPTIATEYNIIKF